MSPATLLLQKLEEVKLLAQDIAIPVTQHYESWLLVGLLIFNNYFLVSRIVQQIVPSKYVLVIPVMQCLTGIALLAMVKISPWLWPHTTLNAIILFCAFMAITGSIVSMYRLRMLKNARSIRN